jgi:hypothetical protein
MNKTAEKRRVKQEISDILFEEIEVSHKLARLNELFMDHEQTDYQTIVETVFRKHLVMLLKQHSEMYNNMGMELDDPLAKINDTLLLSLALSSHKYVKKEGGDYAPPYLRVPLIPLLFSDVFEALPIQQASQWFSFVENNITHISTLIASERPPSSSASAFLVRSFMSLIKRLSRSSDVTFCGRILMCLSKIIPLFDKSGVNTRGKINSSNVTHYQQGVEMPSDSSTPLSERLNKNFYTNFWKAVTYFQDYTSAQKSEQDWTFIVETVNMILDNFGANNEANCVLGPITNWDERTGKNVSSGYFSPKYLTSPQLMLLEVTEPFFREHILIQMLIYFQGIKSRSDPALPELKKEIISEFEKKIKNQLSIFSTSENKRISHTIEHVLSREQNWIQWKKMTCYPFNKDPDTLEEGSVTADVVKPPKKKSKLGNENLGSVYDNAAYINRHNEEHKRTPVVSDFLGIVIEEIDDDEQIKSCNDEAYQWRANRLIAAQDYRAMKLMVEDTSHQQLEESAKKMLKYQTPPEKVRPDHCPQLPPSLTENNNNNNKNTLEVPIVKEKPIINTNKRKRPDTEIKKEDVTMH